MGDKENIEHAKQRDYDSYADLVDNSKMQMSEKESCRRLLSTAFGNTNGDPPDVKQKKMCEFDWELAKHIVHLRVLLGEVLRVVGGKDKKEEPDKPASLWERIIDKLTPWRYAIMATAISAFFAPHSVDVINAIKGAAVK